MLPSVDQVDAQTAEMVLEGVSVALQIAPRHLQVATILVAIASLPHASVVPSGPVAL